MSSTLVRYSVGPRLRNCHVKKSTLRDPPSGAKKIPSPERGEPALALETDRNALSHAV